MVTDKPKSFKRFMQITTWRDPELESLYPILLSIESSCRDINRLMRCISTDGLSGLAGGTVNIAGYRIDDELGRGAMGRVLRATQTSLDRKVAVKVLAPKLAAGTRGARGQSSS